MEGTQLKKQNHDYSKVAAIKSTGKIFVEKLQL